MTELLGLALIALACYLCPPIALAVGGFVLVSLAQVTEGRKK